MTIDCIDGVAETCDFWDLSGAEPLSSSWNGREVAILEQVLELERINKLTKALVLQIAARNQQEVHLDAYRCGIMDCEEEEEGVSGFAFATYVPRDDEFCLADSKPFSSAQIIQSKSLLKKIAKRIKKTAKKIVEYIEEHKEEILIAAAVVAAVTGAYILAGTLGAAGATSDGHSRKKEDEPESPPAPPEPASPPPPAPEPITSSFITELESAKRSTWDPSFAQSILSTDELFQRPIISNSLASGPEKTHSSGHESNFVEPPTPPSSTSNNPTKVFNSLIPFTTGSFVADLENAKRSTWDQSVVKQLMPLIPSPNNPKEPPQDSSSSSSCLAEPHAIVVAIRSALNVLENMYSKIGYSASIPAFQDPSEPFTCINKAGLEQHEKTPPLAPEPGISRLFVTEGIYKKGMGISDINGMANKFSEAFDSARYIQSLGTLGLRVEGVYNHTNGTTLDLAEIFIYNYAGFSPITQQLLRDKWTAFHFENWDNPEAKILHFCHSQGALHTKNALSGLPKEIRDRVIVVNIAGATAISKDLCFQSFNYVSRDPVPWGEGLTTSLTLEFTEDTARRQEIRQTYLDNKTRVIHLDPHKDAPLIDHTVVSPTYTDVIKEHIRNYEKSNGKSA